jgi:hypothetical protein
MPIRVGRIVLIWVPCDKGALHAQSALNPLILLWGFLGGVVWCMYGLGYWYSRRLFDKHYLFWYILNPWIAAVLGGVFTLTILSGLIAAAKGDLTGGWAFLCLVSFVVGLATHDFLKMLVRIVTAVFTEASGKE